MISFIRDLILDFRNLALVIQISMIVIALAIICVFLALIIMLLHRYFKYRRDVHVKHIKPKIERLIYAYIFFNTEDALNTEYSSKEDILRDLNRLTRNRKDKQLATHTLIFAKKTVGGTAGDKITELFYESKLEKHSLRKVVQRKNFKIIQGLSEFVALDAPLADVYIIPLTHHRSRAVRIMARHAYVKLSKNNPFNFFDSNKEDILVWEQIELYNIITTDERLAIPNFSSWISYSKNDSIVKFCLKLVEHYHQVEAIPSIMKLLNSDNHVLRAAAIHTLGNMKETDAEPEFLRIYIEQPIFCKIEILEAMGKIQSGKYIDFLNHELQTGSEYSLRKAAAKALVKNTRENKKFVEDIFTTSPKEQEIMLKHYINPLTA